MTGCFIVLSSAEVPARGTVLAVTVSAEKLVEPCRIRLEREFRDRTVALRALPVSVEHLALEASASHAAIAAFKCHVVLFDL